MPKLLYREIEEYLCTVLQKAQDGDRLPTQTELSRRFNVNHLTARKALGNLEREGLLVRVRGKGTFARKMSVAAPALDLLLLLPERVERFAFWGALFEGLLESLQQQDIRLSIRRFASSFPSAAPTLALGAARGILAPFPADEDLPLLEQMHKDGHAVMVLNRVLEDSPLSYVSSDHQAGMRALTERLIERGHTRIGLIWTGRISYARQRERGFQDALRAAGIEPDPLISPDDSTEAAIGHWLDRFRPTAAALVGGSYVEPLWSALDRRGQLIGRDIAVAMFDAAPDALPGRERVYQALQPFADMGRLAIREMEMLLRGRKTRIELKLPVRIVEGRKAGE